ncbi:MAG: hypothetical protein R3D70_25175 [Rhizobiaceae bacterium]
MQRYAQNLRFGEVFARNDIYQSLVVQSALVEDGLVVLTRAAEADAIKDWAVAMITIRSELFVHRSEHQYFTLQGALKTFCELTGESLRTASTTIREGRPMCPGVFVVPSLMSDRPRAAIEFGIGFCCSFQGRPLYQSRFSAPLSGADLRTMELNH